MWAATLAAAATAAATAAAAISLPHQLAGRGTCTTPRWYRLSACFLHVTVVGGVRCPQAATLRLTTDMTAVPIAAATIRWGSARTLLLTAFLIRSRWLPPPPVSTDTSSC